MNGYVGSGLKAEVLTAVLVGVWMNKISVVGVWKRHELKTSLWQHVSPGNFIQSTKSRKNEHVLYHKTSTRHKHIIYHQT